MIKIDAKKKKIWLDKYWFDQDPLKRGKLKECKIQLYIEKDHTEERQNWKKLKSESLDKHEIYEIYAEKRFFSKTN